MNNTGHSHTTPLHLPPQHTTPTHPWIIYPMLQQPEIDYISTLQERLNGYHGNNDCFHGNIVIVSASYLENVGCLHHLSHEGGDTLELGVAGPDTRQYTVHDGDGCRRTWHKAANLSHEYNHTDLGGGERTRRITIAYS